MEIDKILNRINYSGPLDVNLQVLRDLKRAFLYSVPFENLDIHAKVKITLEPLRFYDKIVTNQRGGFCYECNSLFYHLLREIGFQVHILSARMTTRETPSPRYSHMALKVSLDQDYLVDVGNGQSLMEPMAIPGEAITTAEGIDYRVGRYDELEYALYVRPGNADWTPRFVFSIESRTLEQFEKMCEFHQTSPESIFMKQRLCTLPIPNGRLTLAGQEFTLLNNGSQMKITIGSTEELQEILQKYFNIGMQLSDLS